MCGIAGIVAPDGLDAAALVRMSSALEHRGPDASGFLLYRQGIPLRRAATPDVHAMQGGPPTVGMAHRRLSIIDLEERSDQPMVSPSGEHALIYNGEIYNYLELRDELGLAGHRFLTTSDTEVVLAAYREWGPGCVERFVGMWAFALLDLPRHRLFLSRDRFGIKPLYYSLVRGSLRFASEIKGLLAAGDFEPEPDEDTVRRFLLTGRDDETVTFFKGIFHLPPAHNAVVSLDGPLEIRPTRYWSCEPSSNGRLEHDEEAQFLTLLEESVRLHARADVRVGTCLSGGLDSSAIVCVADQLRRNGEIPQFDHHGFGYVPIDAAYSERRYMEEVADQTRVQMTYVQATSDRAAEIIPLVARQQDEPFGSASIVAQWFVFEAAARAGLKVMLDGQGADETLGGYHAYLPLIARGHLRSWRLLRYARFASEHQRRFGDMPLAARDALASAMPALRGLGDVRKRPLTPAASLLKESFRADWHRADSASLQLRTTDEILRYATARQLPTLLRFEDRNSMAHSVEARVPFLDHRLVEFAFRLPGEAKIRGAVTKSVAREAMTGIVPDRVRTRIDKVGFRADPGLTWRFAGQHRDELLSPMTDFEDRWFDSPRLARLLDCSDGPAELEFALWRVINVKLWLRNHWGASVSADQS